jgi:hypothetical protein
MDAVAHKAIMPSVIFLYSFNGQRASGIPRDAVRKAFGPSLKEHATDFWSIHYDARNSCTIFLEPFDAAHIHQLTIRSPCRDLRFWNSIKAVLGLGNVILHSPDGTRPLLLAKATSRHIPGRMLQALGKPLVVRTGKDIRAAAGSEALHLKNPKQRTSPLISHDDLVTFAAARSREWEAAREELRATLLQTCSLISKQRLLCREFTKARKAAECGLNRQLALSLCVLSEMRSLAALNPNLGLSFEEG